MSSKGGLINDDRSDKAPKPNKRKAKAMSSSSAGSSRTLPRGTPSRGNSGSSQSSTNDLRGLSDTQKLEWVILAEARDYYAGRIQSDNLFVDVLKVTGDDGSENFAASLYCMVEDSRGTNQSNWVKRPRLKSPAVPDEFCAKLGLYMKLVLEMDEARRSNSMLR